MHTTRLFMHNLDVSVRFAFSTELIKLLTFWSNMKDLNSNCPEEWKQSVYIFSFNVLKWKKNVFYNLIAMFYRQNSSHLI